MNDDSTKENDIIDKAQQQRALQGQEFHRNVAESLRAAGLTVFTEVPMSHTGLVLHSTERNSALARLDIVATNDNQSLTGRHISSLIFVSCKRSPRERWLEDSWTLHTGMTRPMLYALVTHEEIPNPIRFLEAEDRFIVTCKPVLKDTRANPHGLNSLARIIKQKLGMDVEQNQIDESKKPSSLLLYLLPEQNEDTDD